MFRCILFIVENILMIQSKMQSKLLFLNIIVKVLDLEFNFVYDLLYNDWVFYFNSTQKNSICWNRLNHSSMALGFHLLYGCENSIFLSQWNIFGTFVNIIVLLNVICQLNNKFLAEVSFKAENSKCSET
jgi:hypothetical protein